MKIKGCYVKKDGKYNWISYRDYKILKENNVDFQKKYFVLFGNSLIEVDEKSYKEINHINNRYDYINRLQKECEMAGSDLNQEDIVVDRSDTTYEQIEKIEKLSRLNSALMSLTRDDQDLVQRIYFLKSNRT